MACSDDTDGWASELEGQLLESLRRDVHSKASFTGAAAAVPCAGNSHQGNSSNSLSGMQLLQQQMSQQVQRGAYRHCRAQDVKQPTQQQQQWDAAVPQQQQQQQCGSQYQQQHWGSVPASSGMLAAAIAPNMAQWQPSTLNYATTEDQVNPEYVGCSSDPVSNSSSDTTGSAYGPPGATHKAGPGFSNRQAAAQMCAQEHARMHTGMKRPASISQDLLLYNLLQEMAPAGRR
jgi:hypothetical protein